MLYWRMTTISDSPAKSSSRSSSPLSFSALSPIPASSGASKKSSMEEVWSDISLSSLDHPSNGSTSGSDTNFAQEFLSRPPPKGKKRSSACPWHAAGQGGQHSRPVKESDNGFFAYETSRVAPMLGLDTRTKIHCVERSHDPSSVEPQLHTTHESRDAFGKAAASFSCSHLDPLNCSSPVEFPILCKKGSLESDDNASDHRNKRLMKNRESAARSRARKQAYTTELELKVSRLVEENGRLRRQLEKHCTATTPAQYPKKHTLQRTLTAPF